MPGLKNRPCGACNELVPSDTGCRHWKPNSSITKRSSGAYHRGRARALAAAQAPQPTNLPWLDKQVSDGVQ